MRQSSPPQSSPIPVHTDNDATVVSAFAAAGLFAAVLVAASYPFAAATVALGALTAVAVRRGYVTLQSVRDRRRAARRRTHNRSGRPPLSD